MTDQVSTGDSPWREAASRIVTLCGPEFIAGEYSNAIFISARVPQWCVGRGWGYEATHYPCTPPEVRVCVQVFDYSGTAMEFDAPTLIEAQAKAVAWVLEQGD